MYKGFFISNISYEYLFGIDEVLIIYYWKFRIRGKINL